MANPKQLFPIPFAAGLDQKTDEYQVQPGKLSTFQNGIFKKTGQISKRWGYTELGTNILGSSSTITNAKALNVFNNELLIYDGQNAYSYIKSNNNWANRGEVVSVIQSNQEIIRNTSQQLSPDGYSLGGIQVFAWEDTRGGIRYSITDSLGTLLVVDQPLFTTMTSD